jgi:hypothetical protein
VILQEGKLARENFFFESPGAQSVGLLSSGARQKDGRNPGHCRVIQKEGSGVGLTHKAIATLRYETLIGSLKMIQDDTWELFHDLQKGKAVRRGNEVVTHRVLGSCGSGT